MSKKLTQQLEQKAMPLTVRRDARQYYRLTTNKKQAPPVLVRKIKCQKSTYQLRDNVDAVW
jgi:hypothetical protein